MDYIKEFQNALEAAENAQSIASLVDAAFKPSSGNEDLMVLDDDALFLDPNGYELSFSYKECLVEKTSYAAALF